MKTKKKVAVIGGGIAGLTAGYYLCDKYDITLYEKSHRIGGNAYTYTTHDNEKIDIAVAAFGKAGYKNFYMLLDQLGIQTALCANSYMSFHNLDSKKGLYITLGLKGIRDQGFEIFKPNRLVALIRLYAGVKRAQDLFDRGKLKGITLNECIQNLPELRGDARMILLSTLCLISSMSAPEVLKGPAEFFIHKLKVHHDIISPKAVYSVRCVESGTHSYVDALTHKFRDKIVLNSKIKTVQRTPNNIALQFEDGNQENFDKVVFACNADQALKLLADPVDQERRLLGVWKYKEGRVVVHRDHSSFPARELIQAYTFLYTEQDKNFETSVNGALWHEPQVSSDCDYISSQHPNFPIRPELIEFDTHLRTPVFDFESYQAISELPTLNGTLNSFYCGSHFGFGLHDDAVSSAMSAVRKLEELA